MRLTTCECSAHGPSTVERAWFEHGSAVTDAARADVVVRVRRDVVPVRGTRTGVR